MTGSKRELGSHQFDDLIAGVESIARGTQSDSNLRSLSSAETCSGNQFVILIKPEAATSSQGVKFEKVVDLLQSGLTRYDISVGAIRIMTGATIERLGIMERHYGVINRISRLGEAALSPKSRAQLHKHFGKVINDGSLVLGGHAFLDGYPSHSPESLSTLFSDAGSTRLAAGTYACSVVLGGQGIVLLNGFHPHQLRRFTNPDAVTVVLEGCSATHWKTLRQDFVGATDPRVAVVGSLRERLINNREFFGLEEVSQNKNGFHLSAGPVEGMVELRRFFSSTGADDDIDISSTAFGARLLGAGLSRESVESLGENPDARVRSGLEPVFDATEEMDAEEAVDHLVHGL